MEARGKRAAFSKVRWARSVRPRRRQLPQGPSVCDKIGASSDCSRPVNDYVHIEAADLRRPNARFTTERQGYQVLTPFGKLGYSPLFYKTRDTSMPPLDDHSAQLPSDWTRLKGQHLKRGGQAIAVPVRHRDGREGVYRQMRNRSSDVERKRFKREVGILTSGVQHRAVVTLYEWDADVERSWYISELGESFPHWWRLIRANLKHRQTDLVEKAVSILLELASALASCHDNGVVHRDIKPNNLIVKKDVADPWPILIDFGIAHEEKGEPPHVARRGRGQRQIQPRHNAE